MSYLFLGVLSLFVNNAALTLGMTDCVYIPYQDAAAWGILLLPAVLYILLCIWHKRAARRVFVRSTIPWLLACGAGILLCMLPYRILKMLP